MAEPSDLSELMTSTRNTLLAQRQRALQMLLELQDTDGLDAVGETLLAIMPYMFERARAVFVLIQQRLEWDAEILLRSFYECGAKVLYLTLIPEPEQASAAKEYWEDLGALSERKIARRASFVEASLPSDNQETLDVFQFVQQEFGDQSDADRLSKADRRRLEQKWSYTELIEAVARAPTRQGDLSSVRALLHIYGIASHLAHADSTAMTLIADRSTRRTDEKLILEDAHCARMLTDMASIGAFCLQVLRKHLKLPKARLEDIEQLKDQTLRLSEPYLKEFYESQRAFYDRVMRSA